MYIYNIITSTRTNNVIRSRSILSEFTILSTKSEYSFIIYTNDKCSYNKSSPHTRRAGRIN